MVATKRVERVFPLLGVGLALASILPALQLAAVAHASPLQATVLPLVLLLGLAVGQTLRRAAASVRLATRPVGRPRPVAATWRVRSASRQSDPTAAGRPRPRAPGVTCGAPISLARRAAP